MEKEARKKESQNWAGVLVEAVNKNGGLGQRILLIKTDDDNKFNFCMKHSYLLGRMPKACIKPLMEL